MAFDVNNFVVDRVVRAVALSQTDDSVLFSINQVTNPSLNVTSETAEAVDALGTPIAIFNRAKTAEFSAENALFDMNLMAVQSGTSKTVASNAAPIVTPKFEIITISSASTYALSKTPIEDPAKIYKLNGDEALGTAYTKGSSASATQFAISSGTITPPTGLSAGDRLMVIYEYNATGADDNGAVAVINTAKNFPTGCKLVMEVLGCDVCDQTELVYAYLVFPNFKLSSDFDWSIATVK